MKSIVMLLAGTAAVLAVNTSSALSQDACSKGYLICMNLCVERPTKDSQQPCLQSCQVKNNRCSEEIYGSRKEVVPKSTVTTTNDSKKPADKEAVSPPPRKVDIAPRAEAKPP
ncbi:MAG: hypothetical protein ACREDY_12750, partial [Bradyrhizobium sp.]